MNCNGFSGVENASRVPEAIVLSGCNQISRLQEGSRCESAATNGPELQIVPCRARRTPFWFPSQVTAFLGRPNGASPAAKITTKTNTQIRPGILARIIFLVAQQVARRKLPSES